ncbi:MAG: hypothetical protein CM15mV54_700 [Caudoviricetes sp.]|nr:MAG: hypothetical protein CM15mV54_700 [Caudoviricetes sp.]
MLKGVIDVTDISNIKFNVGVLKIHLMLVTQLGMEVHLKKHIYVKKLAETLALKKISPVLKDNKIVADTLRLQIYGESWTTQ